MNDFSVKSLSLFSFVWHGMRYWMRYSLDQGILLRAVMDVKTRAAKCNENNSGHFE